MFRFVTFLGNPGEKYSGTRHNMGWMISECCQFLQQLSWVKKFKGVYAVQVFNGERVYFLKPLTYMNKSGDSVQELLHFFKIKPEELLVVYDDIELDFGYLDVKKGGGLGGHNGLKSIAQRLGTRDFYRFRIGVSRPAEGEDVSAYVLGGFKPDEKKDLPLVIEKSSQALTYILDKGTQASIKKYKKANLLE